MKGVTYQADNAYSRVLWCCCLEMYPNLYNFFQINYSSLHAPLDDVKAQGSQRTHRKY